jgi:hypothetical protein
VITLAYANIAFRHYREKGEEQREHILFRSKDRTKLGVKKK